MILEYDQVREKPAIIEADLAPAGGVKKRVPRAQPSGRLKNLQVTFPSWQQCQKRAPCHFVTGLAGLNLLIHSRISLATHSARRSCYFRFSGRVRNIPEFRKISEKAKNHVRIDSRVHTRN
jgi:hypothetical protein